MMALRRAQTKDLQSFSWSPDFISLQDMCKLYLLATIDDYPVDILAKLPLHMRKKLFMAMPVIDRLHYEGTVFLDGLEVITAVDPSALEAEMQGTNSLKRIVVSDMVTRSVMNSNKVYLICDWHDTEHFTQDMAEILFPPFVSVYDFKWYCAINFARGCFNSFLTMHPNTSSIHSDSDLIYCVKSFNLKRCKEESDGEGKKSTSILNVESVVKPKINSPVYLTEVDDRNLIIPSRLAKFLRNTTELYPKQLEFQSTHFEAFIKYCKLWSRIPKVLEIECNELILESPLWKYFLTRHTQPDGGRVVYSYLKKLLSSVETLQLSTLLPKQDVYLNFSVLRDVVLPVIRSCAGHNMESRCLKQIEITSINSLEAALELLASVQEFLCRGGDRYTTIFNHDNAINAPLNESACPAPLDFHHSEPYLIESLSIESTPFISIEKIQKEEIETISRSLLERFGDILVQQLPSLRRVVVKLLIRTELQASNNFLWSAKSIYTIMPALLDFVRQPQFQSLSLTMMTPDLLDAFLTTPATHDQLLSIDEGFTVWADQPHDITHHMPDPCDIPSNNLKFKSLDMSSFNSVCSDKVMAARVLRLKMLRIPVESLASIREDAIIEVSHVKIDLASQNNWCSSSSLFPPISSFLRKNVHLCILELFPCGSLSLVNHCLEQLTKSPVTLHAVDPVNHPTTVAPLILPPGPCRQTLEEIRLHFSTPLLSYVTGSQYGGNVPQGLSSRELDREISRYNQPLFNLFVLIRNLSKLRVTERLVIIVNHLVAYDFRITGNEELLRMIVKQSGDSRVKKIVLKGYNNTRTRKTLSKDLETFELIAEKVVVDS